jgi:hypothetical protein
MGRACNTRGCEEECIRVLVSKTAGKRPLGRTRRRWENNIKIDVREIEISGMNWINLAEVRDQWRAHANMEVKLQVPQNVAKFLST